MKRKVIVIVMVFLMTLPIVSIAANNNYSQPTSSTNTVTYRDKHGVNAGSSKTVRQGNKSTTTYRDKHGIITGSSESITRGNKTTTTYKDKHGKNVGSKVTTNK